MVELSGTSTERAAALSRLETAMRFPVGSVSPLWLMFAGAASAGVAYWWMSRWTRPVNLEALLAVRAPLAPAEPVVEAAIEALVIEAPFVEVAEAVAAEASEPAQATVTDAEIETEAREAAALAPAPAEPEALAEALAVEEPVAPELKADAPMEVEVAPEPAALAPAPEAPPAKAAPAKPAAKKAPAKAKSAASTKPPAKS